MGCSTIGHVRHSRTAEAGPERQFFGLVALTCFVGFDRLTRRPAAGTRRDHVLATVPRRLLNLLGQGTVFVDRTGVGAIRQGCAWRTS
jgi:hypothetical protein